MKTYLLYLLPFVIALTACSSENNNNNSDSTNNSTESLTIVTSTVNTSDIPSAIATKATSIISLTETIDFQQATSGASIAHTQGLPTIIVSDNEDILMMTTESVNGQLVYIVRSLQPSH